MLKVLRPSLEGSNYANLVTVFAVILAVEYSTESYDIWDAVIGLFSIGIGYAFIAEARKNKDFWFSFITASLISLGLLSMYGVVAYVWAGYHETHFSGEAVFLLELKRFAFFIVIAAGIHFVGIRGKYSKRFGMTLRSNRRRAATRPSSAKLGIRHTKT